jgi:hypothetical protein
MRLFRCEAPHGIVPPVITFLAEGENGRKASTLPTRTSTTTAVLQQPGGFCTAFDQTIPQKQQVKIDLGGWIPFVLLPLHQLRLMAYLFHETF